MIHLLPFTALRYDPAKVQMAHVLCPPREELRAQPPALGVAALFNASPYSAIRLELGCPAVDFCDPTGVTGLINRWRADSILRSDDAPALYLYEQTTDGEKKMGIIGLRRLKDYFLPLTSGRDADHHAADLTLLRATRLQCAPSVASFAGDEASDSAFEQAMRTAELAVDCMDAEGSRHRLWQVSDPGSVLLLRDCFIEREDVVRFGQERCVTHLQYRNERRAEDVGRTLTSGRTGQLAVDTNAPYEWMMVALFPERTAAPQLPAGLVMYALEG